MAGPCVSEHSQGLGSEEPVCLDCPAESVKGCCPSRRFCIFLPFCGSTGDFFLAGKQDNFCDPRAALGNPRLEQEDASAVPWEWPMNVIGLFKWLVGDNSCFEFHLIYYSTHGPLR